MSIRITLCALLAAAAAPVRATETPTGTIVGRVSDRVTGSGMRFANVIVVDSLSVEKNERFLISGPWGATAQENGRFVIHDVPLGEHRLKASYVGYHPAYGNVTVAAGKTTSVRLMLQNTYPRETVRVPKGGTGRIPEDPKVRAYQNMRAILGIGDPIEIASWGPSEAGRGGGTIRGARDSAFAYEQRTRRLRK